MKRLWIVGLIGVIAVSGVVVLPTAQAVMNKPMWSVGDYWAYNVTGASSTMPAAGTIRADVASTSDAAVVDGVSYPSFRLSAVAYLQMPSLFGIAYVNLTGNGWYRVTDLSLVKEDMSGTYVIPGFISGPFAEHLAWSPPQLIQWPLTTAITWSTRSWLNVTLSIFGIPNHQNTTVRTDWVVDPDTPTRVPAGLFPTTPLHGNDVSGTQNISYWSADAGNFVLQRVLNRTGVETQRVELTSYRYAVVQDTAPPSITDAKPTPALQDAGGTVTISANVTDDILVARVSVNVTVPGGTHVNGTMTHGSGNRWSHAQTWSTVGDYSFVIWASDSVGKWASAPGSFRIRQPDTEAPVITHTPPGGPFYTDTSIAITATVTDNVAVHEVRIDFTNATGARQNLTMSNGTGGSTYTFTIPAQKVTGTVTYRIYAVDPSGNVAVTQQYSVTIAARGGISDYLIPLVVIVIVLVVVVALAAVLWRRRKKAASPPSGPPATPPPFDPPPPP